MSERARDFVRPAREDAVARHEAYGSGERISSLRYAQRERQAPLEVLHVADETGMLCDYCGRTLVGPKADKRYPRGMMVVVYEEDANVTWMTNDVGNRQRCGPW